MVFFQIRTFVGDFEVDIFEVVVLVRFGLVVAGLEVVESAEIVLVLLAKEVQGLVFVNALFTAGTSTFETYSVAVRAVGRTTVSEFGRGHCGLEFRGFGGGVQVVLAHPLTLQDILLSGDAFNVVHWHVVDHIAFVHGRVQL